MLHLVIPLKCALTDVYSLTDDTTVSYSTVVDLLKAIDVHKSSGIENISATVLKDALLILAPQLTTLINDCLHNVAFPRAWASATVVPLYQNQVTCRILETGGLFHFYLCLVR